MEAKSDTKVVGAVRSSCFRGTGNFCGLNESCAFISVIGLLGGAGFALLGEFLLAVAPKGTKKSCPCIRPCAARRVRSLHRCSRGRLTRAVPGPLSLSPHPCGSLPYATVPLTLLKGAVGVACGFVQKGHATDTSRSFKRLGLRSPSGGRVEVLRRGTRGMDAERGAKGQGRPFVTAPGAAPERGESGHRPDPDVGRAFSLVTFSFARAKRK